MAAVKLPLNKGSYHGRVSQDSWRRSRTLSGKAIGIELEVESDGGYENALAALPEHDRDIDGPQPHFESDGSLNSYDGVEIVFPPYSPRAIRDGTAYVNKAMAGLGRLSSLNLSTRCGMHMNVNVNGWSRHKLAIFVGVIHNMPLATLERLGGRRLNHYCQQRRGSSLSEYSSYPQDGHSNAVEHKHGGGRIELRFPAATVDLTVLTRLAAFIDLLDDYAAAMPENYNETPEAHYNNFILALRQSPDGEANALAAYLAA